MSNIPINQQITNVWQQGNLDPPKIPLLLSTLDDQLYIVIEDSTPVFRIMDQYGILYAVPRDKCSIDHKYHHYRCSEFLYPLSCRPSIRDRYAYDNILSLIFSGDVHA